jgi:MATE family multidrug resistance protein
MGGMGLLLALSGPWLLPMFIDVASPGALEVLQLAQPLLWIAAAYQLFDGLSMGSGMCLRGGGDAVVPAALVIVLSWVLFLPLAHALTFATGQGWVHVLPQWGWGARGGWTAVVVYVFFVSLALQWRWHARSWQAIRI